MLRRVHVPQLRVGKVTLDASGSKHARDVLRLGDGTEVEVFDDAGNVATGVIVELKPQVTVRVDSLAVSQTNDLELTIAAAVPKGERADWMIEKLSELGVSRFIPLAAERSVVLPEGRNKRDRWIRIATESAKQSRRRGVMRIDELTTVAQLIAAGREPAGFFLSTAPDSVPIASILTPQLPPRVLLLIGPEGGWTDQEIQQFSSAGMFALKLTDTVLRVETAAIAAGSVIMTLAASKSPGPT